jgi:hypothetical protein
MTQLILDAQNAYGMAKSIVAVAEARVCFDYIVIHDNGDLSFFTNEKAEHD